MSPPRMTLATQRVLRELIADSSKELYGLEIGQAAGLPSGTVHPILARLEAANWLESHWEDIDPSAEGRPRRRYYVLTPEGGERARTALAQVDAGRPRSTRVTRPGLAGGLA